MLTGGPSPTLSDGPPDALGIAGYTSGMGPLLGHWIDRGELAASPATAALFRLHLRHNRLRMERFATEAGALVRAMRDAGIEPTLLKGMHTAFGYFPEPAARPMSDIDLLVPADLVAAAQEVLADRGYTRMSGTHNRFRTTWIPPDTPAVPRSLSLTHAGDPYSVDLHGSVDRDFQGGRIVPLSRLARPADRRLDALECGAGLGQPLLLLYLAAHASALRSLNLLRLVELVLVIRKDEASGALDWDQLLAAARTAEAGRFIYPAFELAGKLAPGTVPSPVLEALRRASTARVRRVVADLTPATAMRLHAMSLRERYMWDASAGEVIASVARSFWPSAEGYSPKEIARIYAQRVWRIVRGRVVR